MFESTKVVLAMIKLDIIGWKIRKEYGYGNANHGVRESRELVYKYMHKLTGEMIKGSAMNLDVRGVENLPTEGPTLYVANHTSIFDTVVIANIVKEPCIFIGKKEVSKMPFISRWFEALGCIYIDREDKRQSLECILRGIEELKSGQSIILFPEGTRTMGNEMKPFKEGGFKLATKTGVKIVPIALVGTDKVYEETKLVKKAKVYVNIGRIIETSQLDKIELKNLPKITENRVIKLLDEIIKESM